MNATATHCKIHCVHRHADTDTVCCVNASLVPPPAPPPPFTPQSTSRRCSGVWARRWCGTCAASPARRLSTSSTSSGGRRTCRRHVSLHTHVLYCNLPCTQTTRWLALPCTGTGAASAFCTCWGAGWWLVGKGDARGVKQLGMLPCLRGGASGSPPRLRLMCLLHLLHPLQHLDDILELRPLCVWLQSGIRCGRGCRGWCGEWVDAQCTWCCVGWPPLQRLTSSVVPVSLLWPAHLSCPPPLTRTKP